MSDDQAKAPAPTPPEQGVQVVLRPDHATAPALYANVCIVNRLGDSFFLDFLLADPVSVAPGGPRPVEGKHVARIVIERPTALTLGDQLAKQNP